MSVVPTVQEFLRRANVPYTVFPHVAGRIDRFLTSSFRPEFYTTLGVDWVNNNGPDVMMEPGSVNGHENQPMLPLKRVLMRVVPELRPELEHVVNAFDPWARDRGEYYDLAWKPRNGAKADEAFAKP